MDIRVTHHAMAWDVANQRGAVSLVLEDGTRVDQLVATPGDLAAISAILQGKHVFFRKPSTLLTAWEAEAAIALKLPG